MSNATHAPSTNALDIAFDLRGCAPASTSNAKTPLGFLAVAGAYEQDTWRVVRSAHPAVILQAWTKKVITKDDWEKKLAAVKIAKEDMNRLVMNFLVTEVS